MITYPVPKEFPRQSITVLNGAGSKAVDLSGYLDWIIFDVPISETYKFSIKGPSGIEYYVSPVTLTGDATIVFATKIPLTGKMTFSIIGGSADGTYFFYPIGNIK